MNSLQSLQTKLPEGVAALIYEDCTIRWLTGFCTDNGLVYVSKKRAVLLTDSRYSEAASKTVTSMAVQDSSALCKDSEVLCREDGIETILLEQHATPISRFSAQQEIFSQYTLCSDDTLDTWIRDLRSIKTEHELACLSQAQRITDAGFSYILGRIEAGRSEKDIALDLEFYMRKNGAEAVSFDFICVSGANSSLPHGVPGDKLVERGDFVTLDFGAVYGGMHSDMTRTIAVGFVSDEQREVYNTVLKAQKECLSVLKAGLLCKEGDAAARDVISQAGYGQYFGHSTGHGVGFEIHEYPNLSPRNTENRLQSGQVVTVEPGIYLPGKFGVRIEDMAYITEFGCENLTRSEKNLIIL